MKRFTTIHAVFMKTVVALAVSMTSFACTSCDDDDVTPIDPKNPEVPEVIVPEASKFNVTFKSTDDNNNEVVIATAVNVDSASTYVSADLFATLKASEPSKRGYEFKGWNPSTLFVDADTEVNAEFSAIEYAIRFYGADSVTVVNEINGLTIGTDTADFAINADIVNEFGFKMKAWSMDKVTIDTCDVNIYPLFNESHKLTVYGFNDELVHSINVEHGREVNVDEYSVPMVEGYDAKGWSLDGKLVSGTIKVEGDMTFKAEYDVHMCLVVIDGVEQKVAYGDLAEVEVPTKAETESETYEFKGWFENGVKVDLEGMAITRDMVVVSEFKSIAKTFEVKFIVDGVEFKSEVVEYGKSATAPTADKEGYTMKWVGNYENVTKDEVVVAEYEAISDTEVSVKFVGYNEGTKVVKFAWNESVSDAGVIAKLGNLEVEGYTWKYENCVVTYTINTFKVTFDFGGIRENVEVEVEYGKSAVAPSDVEVEGYTFDGWDGEFENVTSDNVVYAKYTEWGFEIEKIETGARITPNSDNDYFVNTINKTAYDNKCCIDGVVDNTKLIEYLVAQEETTLNGTREISISKYEGKITFAVYVKKNAEGNFEVIGNVKEMVW